MTNSSFAHLIPVSMESGNAAYEIIKIASDCGRDETAAQVHAILKSRIYDVLVVDTFPRGLGGELQALLPRLTCPKILVHRDLNPRYCATVDLESSIRAYDRLIVPGESAPFGDRSHAVRTAPWLLRDCDELLLPQAAQSVLHAESVSVPVVAVLGCGRKNEIDEMQLLAGRLSEDFAVRALIRFVTPLTSSVPDPSIRNSNSLTLHLWPFLEVIRGVDVVIGSGGYNTVNECVATRTPLIGIPQQRLYDRQETRLRSYGALVNPESVAERLSDILDTVTESHVAPDYRNGVHEALKQIRSM